MDKSEETGTRLLNRSNLKIAIPSDWSAGRENEYPSNQLDLFSPRAICLPSKTYLYESKLRIVKSEKTIAALHTIKKDKYIRIFFNIDKFLIIAKSKAIRAKVKIHKYRTVGGSPTRKEVKTMSTAINCPTK